MLLQLKFTVSPVVVAPLVAATVIVTDALLPAGTLAGLTAPAVRVYCASIAAQAFAKFVTSGEPRPVTWSYPTPALNPISVVPVGQSGFPVVHGTMLFPLVTS